LKNPSSLNPYIIMKLNEGISSGANILLKRSDVNERFHERRKIAKREDAEPKASKIKHESLKSSSSLLLIICCSGIYCSFLTWSYLQEKISSKNYSQEAGSTAFFRSTLVINVVQSFFAILFGIIYTSIKLHRLFNPFSFLHLNIDLLPKFLLIAISQSISSPIAYLSLGHVDYVLYLLAKSCKLIPVMIVHRALYKSKFPMYKYLAALIITLGVFSFTFGRGSKGTGKVSNDGRIMTGLFELLISLLLDGYTNSTQDQLFKITSSKSRVKTERMTAGHLMTILNLLTFSLTLCYSLFFTNQWNDLSDFISANGPEVLFDITGFGLLGALGQIFIFITLESFNSVVLVTVTVTRKMLSMCLSVLLYGHTLEINQWIGLALVFSGISLETAFKLKKVAKKT